MASLDEAVSIVRLIKTSEEPQVMVTVGVAIRLGIHPREFHFNEQEMDHPPSLHASKECLERFPGRKLLIACAIAATSGIETFRIQYPSSFDYRITLLDGQNLSDDCTIGFSLAGHKAAVRAVGSIVETGEETYGWTEI
jgi:hypothetical protein